jgi:hypothetical protein
VSPGTLSHTFLCVCARVVSCVFVCSQRGHRSTSDVISQETAPCILKQSLSLGPGAHQFV